MGENTQGWLRLLPLSRKKRISFGSEPGRCHKTVWAGTTCTRIDIPSNIAKKIEKKEKERISKRGGIMVTKRESSSESVLHAVAPRPQNQTSICIQQEEVPT